MGDNKGEGQDRKWSARKTSLGGVWMALDNKVSRLGMEHQVILKEIRFQRNGEGWRLIIKGRFGLAEARIKFIEVKDLAHAGDALQYALTAEGWKEDKPFDVDAWRARNRKAL